jgi:hypothetical protein
MMPRAQMSALQADIVLRSLQAWFPGEPFPKLADAAWSSVAVNNYYIEDARDPQGGWGGVALAAAAAVGVRAAPRRWALLRTC